MYVSTAQHQVPIALWRASFTAIGSVATERSGSSRGRPPGRGPAEAVLAHPSVAEERRGGAQGAEVVQRLDDADVRAVCGAESGRAEQRERVVEVDDVGPEARDRAPHHPCSVTRPHDTAGQRQRFAARPAGDVVALDGEHLDRDARAAEEARLLLDYRVLAARLRTPIPVVDDQHPHSITGTDGQPRPCRG